MSSFGNAPEEGTIHEYTNGRFAQRSGYRTLSMKRRMQMFQRILGVFKLDVNTFEEIEHDQSATSQELRRQL